MNKGKIVLVGAGLAGSLMSIYLANSGYEVEVFESRPDMRKENISGGKSINLALSHRGIRPLEEVGVLDEILKIAVPMRGRMIHDLKGNVSFQPYGQFDHEYINSVSRGELNKILMTAAEKTGKVKINFDSPCTGFDLQTGEIIIQGERKQGVTVIGADGAGSAIRYSMQKKPLFNFSQEFLEYGYKELEIPARDDGAHRIEANALHIWPRKSFMLIALPNPDGSFTATLFLKRKGKISFDSLKNEDEVSEFFKQYFSDVYELMPTLLEDFFRNPIGILGTIRCEPWYHEGKSLLIGDAAHAIVPFYGQGMNAAFEDCRILNGMMESFLDDWEMLFKEFSNRRKPDTEAIADLALENFTEMRDSVSDPHFLLEREAELALYKEYPQEIMSKYSMVTFSSMPYALAKKKGEVLRDVVRELVKGDTNLENFDLKSARDSVLAAFKNHGL